MLYHSDLAEPLTIGDRITSYIVRTREDGKLDLAPNPIGMARLKTNSDYILQLLTERGGSLPLGDKSSAILAGIQGVNVDNYTITLDPLTEYNDPRYNFPHEAIQKSL